MTARPTPPRADEHELRLVVDDAKLHAFRQRSPDILDRAADSGRDGYRVRAELLDDARADDLALQPMCDAAPDCCRLANVGDVPQQHRHIASRGHDGAAKVVDGLRATERTHGPLDGALSDDAA